MSVFTVNATTTGSVVSIKVTPQVAGSGSVTGGGTTVLLTAQTDPVSDQSPLAATFTTNSISTGTVSGTPNGNYYYFDGGILEAAYNDAYNFYTNDFTIEFWMKTDVDWSSQSSGAIVEQKNNDGTDGWTVYHNTTEAGVAARLTQQNDFTTITVPTTGVWEHWALVRIGNTLTWYYNGSVDSTFDVSGISPIQDTSAWLKLGQAATWGGYLSQVSIHGLRIVNGAGVYTGAFTPTPGDLSNITIGGRLDGTIFNWVREGVKSNIGGTTIYDYNSNFFSSYTNEDNALIPVGKAYLYFNSYWTDIIDFGTLVGTNVTFDDAGIGPQNPAEGNIDSWDGSTLVVSIVSGSFTNRTTLDKLTYGY